VRAAFAVALLVTGFTSVGAATTSATFNVSLIINPGCLVSATPLAFGSSGVIAVNIDNTSTLTVTCTNGMPYNVGLDAGTGTGATIATRLMTASSNTVNYTLYQDLGRSILWGNTVGTNTVSGTGSGSAQAITVYGRVPTQSTPAPASYGDTVMVTVSY
jgi:spore coat protein U-like protein